jgi:molybdopterin-containing oxidoreductase family iron-sulfur binding subunit
LQCSDRCDAINEAFAGNGKHIDWSVLNNSKSGVDADFAKLVDDMNAAASVQYFIHDANPAYTWYDAEKFKNALKKVKVSVSFSPIRDETTLLCKYVVSKQSLSRKWGDAEQNRLLSLMQPTIHPLFKQDMAG